ncbi:alpha/beta hydrolase [Actinoplanes sp. NPDC020271]|uniref:alpha/beta hydrolase n=1 Tax=Actinoplanes sp. NPDC020271 TaxID=3363896 RepID=UPI00378AEF6D
MSLDSLGTEITAVVVAVLSAVALSAVWNRGRGWQRISLRTVTAVLCLLSAAASGLLAVNRQVEIYPTWSSLTGGSPDGDVAVPASAPVRHSPKGQILNLSVAGPASNLTMPVYVYLPPGYQDDGTVRYPVVEALHGYPGSPTGWLNRLHVAKVLDQEIKTGRMAPTIVLFPYQTPDPLLDTECTNLAGGPQTETFLTKDVPAVVRARFPVRTDAGWGLIGYSAGGYCAIDLAMRHPGQYTAGAAMSGYAEPGIAIGNGTEKTLYNDLWRLKHLPVPAVALYLAAARADGQPLRDTHALAQAAHAPLSVTTSYIDGGGHNVQTWQAMEAPAFDWLSTQLGRPVTSSTPAPADDQSRSPASLAIAPHI